MAQLSFTPNLTRHVASPAAEVPGANLAEVLQAYLRDHPQVRGYVLDDQDRLRKHVAIFLNGKLIRDRDGLSDPVAPADEIFVVQALSGG